MKNFFATLLISTVAVHAQGFYGLTPQNSAMNEGFNQTTTGKPFSATEERRSLQILSNGTRIENTQSNNLYRDSDGRTRVEDMNGLITVVDPVANFRAELNPKTKAARKAVPATAGFSIWFSGSNVGRGTRMAVAPDATSYQSTVNEFLLQLRNGRGTVANAAPETTENLGTQAINGVFAQGTRTTVTIPKGQIGNDREIKVITERWFSNDLNLLVKSVNSDPRFGDTTYQLTRISQASPEPSLFQIPSDYTVTPNNTPGPGRGGTPGGRGGRGTPFGDATK